MNAIKLFGPGTNGKWADSISGEPAPEGLFSRDVIQKDPKGRSWWYTYERPFRDFVLECSFRWTGPVMGAIVLRGAQRAGRPFLRGYELGFDWAREPELGHISFSCYPQPNPAPIDFEVDKWHRLCAEVKGETVRVTLDDKLTTEFRDPYFRAGFLSLYVDAGMHFKDMQVTELSGDGASGAETLGTELFNGWTTEGWQLLCGHATIDCGSLKLTRVDDQAGMRTTGVIGYGQLDLSVWCRGKAGRSYTVSLERGDGKGRRALGMRARQGALEVFAATSEREDLLCACPIAATPWPEYWRLTVRSAELTIHRFGRHLLSAATAIPPENRISIGLSEGDELLTRVVRYTRE